MFEALQLRQIGFAYRRPFGDFLHQFRFINMEAFLSNSDEPSRCRDLIGSADLEKDEGVAIGKTMVFMKKQAAVALTKRFREALAAWEPLVSCIECLYKKLRRKLE